MVIFSRQVSKLLGLPVVVLSFVSLLSACGDGIIFAPLPSGYASIQLALDADGPRCGDRGCSGIAPGVAEAWVQIDRVTVHLARTGWVVVSTDPVSVDLLRLPEYAANLGFAHIPAGKITQIRLYVAGGSESYVVKDDGSRVPMVVPSGAMSGVKVLGKWEIGPCTENIVTLTIRDHHNAIHVHPNGKMDLYIFRPVIMAGELITEEGECDETGGGGNNGGDDNNGGQDCIPGDDAFPCPGDGRGGNGDSGDDGSPGGGDSGDSEDDSSSGGGDSGDDGSPGGGDSGDSGDDGSSGGGDSDDSGDDGSSGGGDSGDSSGGDDTEGCDSSTDDTCRP